MRIGVVLPGALVCAVFVVGDGGARTEASQPLRVPGRYVAFVHTQICKVPEEGGCIQTVSVADTSVPGQGLLPVGGSKDGPPAWSPDGGTLAFALDRHVFVMRPNGSRRRPLIEGRDPAWSPDGRRLVVAQTPFLVVVDRSGNEVTRIRTDSGYAFNPEWSPDGTRILYRDLFRGVSTVPATGGSPTLLAEGSDPSWSTDGTQILHTGTDPANRHTGVYVMNADGTGRRRLAEGYVSSENAWSPDGRRILFTLLSGDNRGVFLISPDGTGRTRLDAGGAYPFGAAWSPDGSRIAFPVFEGHPHWLVTMDPDGGHRTRVTSGREGSIGSPVWQPAAAELAVSVRGPRHATSGRAAHYVVTVTNLGAATASRVVLELGQPTSQIRALGSIPPGTAKKARFQLTFRREGTAHVPVKASTPSFEPNLRNNQHLLSTRVIRPRP
jgi:dipeptidyl aminopeptidase/acylaminoacyl peptidase